MQAKTLNQKISTWHEIFWRIQTIFHHTVRRFIDERCSSYSAVLTGITIAGVVPIAFFLSTLLHYFGLFDALGQQSDEFFSLYANPSSIPLANQFLLSCRTQAAHLFIVSFLVLAGIAMLVLRIVDETINKIFKSESKRLKISNFLLYWSVLTVCPLLISGSFFFSLYVFKYEVSNNAIALQAQLIILLPIILNTLVFTLIYVALPNRKVKFSHALIGGFIVTLIMESLKLIVLRISALFGLTELVYMLFCLSIVFFVWIYLSWFTLLAGALVVHGLSSNSRPSSRVSLPPMISALVILSVVLSRFKEGASTEFSDVLREGWQISQEDWEQATAWLEIQQLITFDHHGNWMLSQSLDVIMLSDFIEKAPWPSPSSEFVNLLTRQDGWPLWFKQLIDYLQQVGEAQKNLLKEPLSELYSTNREKDIYK